MIPAQQYSIFWEPDAPRRGMNKICELGWRLPRVTAELIYLAGSRLDKKQGIVFEGLMDHRIDDPGMRGADRVDSALTRGAIALHNILQLGAGTSAQNLRV
jgi:hypothetical protein